MTKNNQFSQTLTLTSGDLSLCLQKTADGIKLENLIDLKTGHDLVKSAALPLFTVTLRRVGGKDETILKADSGWQETQIELAGDTGNEGHLILHWRNPDGIRVMAKVAADAAHHAVCWSLHIENSSQEWSLWQVVFPQAAVLKPGVPPSALLPVASGQIRQDVWDTVVNRRAKYPAGWWWGLQFMAVYAQTPAVTGLYVGMHDPLGSAKDVIFDSYPDDQFINMTFDHPVPDMGKPGNCFELPGEAVWQILRGDWFDAAQIYKYWARQQAQWFPHISEDGRSDTPLWMRELSMWVQGGVKTTKDNCIDNESVRPIQRLRDFFGIPLGYHWYQWHRIPFDNDYPHYFPAKEGFTEAVRILQDSGIYVMPYINGRLWDTRDRGTEDFEFTRIALPAATKDEDGKPFIETYGSKEEDGSPVKLAPMCPWTDLWQKRVTEIVLRLFNECGVDGVYIDQISAAEPKLCMDTAHGHPLGGGSWWNQGYWRMLEGIRSSMPAGRMITSECNAEVYCRWLDGFLTWHWMQDGMVPVFPAIYGGQIQMFGRCYGGKAGEEVPTQNLAWRMVAAQQLVFGEQIGWLNLDLVSDNMPLDFIRQVARLRWKLRRYFYAGEMVRPPRLEGNIPVLRADWQWFNSTGRLPGDTWVSMEAVQTGAWRLSQEGRLVLLFANAGDEAFEGNVHFDARDYGIETTQLRFRLFGADGDDVNSGLLARKVQSFHFEQPLNLPPGNVVAMELAL